MTVSMRSQLTRRVCPVAPSSRRRAAGFAQAKSAFGYVLPSMAGLAKHSQKHTGMAGIDTNVWPLGLRERLSG